MGQDGSDGGGGGEGVRDAGLEHSWGGGGRREECGLFIQVRSAPPTVPPHPIPFMALTPPFTSVAVHCLTAFWGLPPPLM